MMVVKKLVFASILFIVCFSSAQNKKLQFGVKGGVNRSFEVVNDAHEIKHKWGYHIGGFVAYTLNTKFSIQTGLYLSEKGGKFVGLNSGNYVGGVPDYKHQFNALYIQAPLLITFKQKISERWNINFGAGTYFAYGISGKSRIDISGQYSDGTNFREWDTFINADEYANESLIRNDFGILFNIELGYNKMFLAFSAEMGLINVLREYEGYRQDLKFYNFNTPISIGYRF